jgi:hypothetical protein
LADNNIKWHIGHSVDLYSYSGGKTLKYRLNELAWTCNCVAAVLRDEPKKKKLQEDLDVLMGMISILRSSYFVALETNPYIPHLRANYEKAMDIVEEKMMRVINRENMTSTSVMQEAMTSLGADRRKRLMEGGDAKV